MTIDELKKRTTITAEEWGEVFGIRSSSAVGRALKRGDAEGAFKIGGKWCIPVPPILRRLGVSTDDDESEQPENVHPLRRAR